MVLEDFAPSPPNTSLPPMKLPMLSRFAVALAFAAALPVAVADTIKLKNGTVLEGSILSESADSVEIEIQVTKGIKDLKVVKKADIAEMKKASADEKEAAELIAKLKETPDGLTAAEYEKRIKTQIQPWLDKHKIGRAKADVEALLKLYNEELAKVKAGDLKVRGEWVPAAELKWNDYNISARRLRAEMDAQLKAKKFVEAYSTFAKMEAAYVASVDFPPAAEAMKKGMASVEAAIARAIEEQPLREKERKQLLGQLSADKKKETEELIKQELADFRTKQAAEKKDKIPVPSFYPYDLKSIQDSLAAAKKESARLATLNTTAMIAANKRFEQGLKDLSEKAYLSAKSAFEAAAKVHSKDATVKKLLEEANKGIAAASKGK